MGLLYNVSPILTTNMISATTTDNKSAKVSTFCLTECTADYRNPRYRLPETIRWQIIIERSRSTLLQQICKQKVGKAIIIEPISDHNSLGQEEG